MFWTKRLCIRNWRNHDVFRSFAIPQLVLHSCLIVLAASAETTDSKQENSAAGKNQSQQTFCVVGLSMLILAMPSKINEANPDQQKIKKLPQK